MSSLTKAIILNVDDNEMCRYAVTRILQNHKFSVTEACNGAEALRLAVETRPDVILLDVNLPDINGFEVCRRLKDNPETARIPVLHVTASYVQGLDKARGLESGAETYLTEPVEPEVLVASINAALRARRAEEAAHSIALEWQATFNSIRDGVMVVDVNGRIQRSNAASERLLGRSTAELMGLYSHELWSDVSEEKGPFARMLPSRKRETMELERDGRILTITADPVFDEAANPAGAVFIVSDITENRRLEEQFRESQKFETIGTLAAGVAHDFNNLLTSIMGNASMAISDETAGEGIRERLAEVVKASQRAADLTQQLLAYAGKARHYTKKLELSDVIREMRQLIESAIPKKVWLELDLAGDLPLVEADPNQIQQLLLNLVTNSAEAIGDESGTLKISTSHAEDAVYLQVTDTGCGMDSETKSRIFDPFFSTKFTGRGLGLAAVAGIARGHKASITVESVPGQGTSFRVAFPAAERPQARPAVLRATPHAGVPTVLVVDDEAMVRTIARAALEMRGYQVLMADNGLEGIRELREHPEVQVVLLDLTMPVMGGEEALEEIISLNPSARVIISTGYDSQLASAQLGFKHVAGYLQKPYTSKQLAEKVAAVLGGGAVIQ